MLRELAVVTDAVRPSSPLTARPPSTTTGMTEFVQALDDLDFDGRGLSLTNTPSLVHAASQ